MRWPLPAHHRPAPVIGYSLNEPGAVTFTIDRRQTEPVARRTHVHLRATALSRTGSNSVAITPAGTLGGKHWEPPAVTYQLSRVESEEPVQHHLSELFGRIRPQCVLDVGANAGQYGSLLRAHGYDGWIVSFEPVYDAFEALREVAARDGRWRAFRLALGSRSESRDISVAEVSQLSSFRRFNRYAAEELPGASEVMRTQTVEVRALNDCWCNCLSGVPCERVFLKLDTQSWDLEVLRGADLVLDRVAGMQLEASLLRIYEGAPQLAETLDHVRRLGFDLTGIFPVNRDSFLRLIEVDCVLIHSGHPNAGEWRAATWAINTQRFLDEVAATIPEHASFVLVDDARLGIERVAGRRAIPFLERHGEYYGPPPDGATAIAELKRLTTSGVRYLSVAWPSFWWLEEYRELADYLKRDWRQTLKTEATIIFQLGNARTRGRDRA